MEVDSEPSTQCNASRIFEGYKALGLIAGDKPFIVRYIDKFEDVRVVIIVGNYFHTYNSKLQLIETSHPHPGPVNALASDSKSVFSCSENKIYAWSGGRRNLYQVFEGHESRIHSLLAFGPHLISVDDSNFSEFGKFPQLKLFLRCLLVTDSLLHVYFTQVLISTKFFLDQSKVHYNFETLELKN